MAVVSSEQQPSQPKPWTRGRRLMVSLPIFIMLLGLLACISNATAVSWNIEPTGQTMATLTSDTAVTFDNPSGRQLPGQGTYAVRERAVTMRIARDGSLVGGPTQTSVDAGADYTWQVEGKGKSAVQLVTVLIREPVTPQDAAGHAADSSAKRPGVVFMHGAGFGTAYNSFGDVAHELASAGFVTAVIDKPVWNTTDVNRDYLASARAYDQVISYLRGLDNVEADKVGIYATSESTWIASYLLRDDPDVAFQILLSPMVFTPRRSLGFFVSQDFTLVGAHDGYQSIVRRLFSIDAGLFSLTNLDIETLNPRAYSIPTYVAYGSKDVMTAQVSGIRAILYEAHQANNWDVTVRSYPVANHVLRLGDESKAGTPFADAYVEDLIDWASGTCAGLEQTSERVAGTNLYQSIGLPDDMHARRAGTIYGLILHASMALLLLASLTLMLVTLGLKIKADARWRRELRHVRLNGGTDPQRPLILGFAHGFGSALLMLAVTTMATLLIFFAGLGQVIMGVVKLAWGGAPTETPGVMYWSWPVIQIVTLLVVWAWSRVFMRLIEAADQRGLVQLPPRKGAVREIVTGAEPVLASRRLGRVLFWLVTAAMLCVLLFFAFWGLFIY